MSFFVSTYNQDFIWFGGHIVNDVLSANFTEVTKPVSW